jgi:thioredoxin reductase (NADPH)
MMEDLKKQAERFGTDVRFGIATGVDFSERPHKVTIDDNKMIIADTVIISTGATAKYLGLDAEKKYAGMGVSACATCDGFFYRGKDVAVVGGGDTAAEEATYLAGLCRKVYLIVRRDVLRASKAMQEKVFRTNNIEILWEHQALDLSGENGVEGATLVRKKGTPEEEEVKIKIDGFFLAIGHSPNSEIFRKYLETDSIGYIKTIPGTSKTNVPGVFAAGDVQDPVYRQAVTAAGSGCMAAIDAERYLSDLNV